MLQDWTVVQHKSLLLVSNSRTGKVWIAHILVHHWVVITSPRLLKPVLQIATSQNREQIAIISRQLYFFRIRFYMGEQRIAGGEDSHFYRCHFWNIPADTSIEV